MKKIIIAHHLVRAYLYTLTWSWGEKYAREIQVGEIVPDEIFEPGTIMMERSKEQSILELALLYLKLNSSISLNTYNGSEFDWSEQSLQYLIDQVLMHWFPIEKPILQALVSSVQLAEMPLEEWRTTIKPGILQMLKEAGIEP